MSAATVAPGGLACGPEQTPEPRAEVARLNPYIVPSAGRRGFLRLDFNENLLGPSPRVVARLRSIEPEDIALYPDEGRARAAVARRFGLGPSLDLVLASGADEAIRLVCDCFVRPGDRVLLVEPGYPLYRFYATLAGGCVVSLSAGEALAFPEEALRREAGRGCRLTILGDPNNPTGSPLPPGLVEDAAAASPETVLLVGEAYAGFAGAPSVALLDRVPNLLVARTFSKAYGLAGLRAGVLLGRRETLAWVARMRSPYAVNAVALLALEAALEDEEHVTRTVAEVRAARSLLADGLERLGVACHPSAANFILARFGERAGTLREALRRRGILVRDRGDHPLLRGTLRIGIGTRAQAEACLAAIEEEA